MIEQAEPASVIDGGAQTFASSATAPGLRIASDAPGFTSDRPKNWLRRLWKRPSKDRLVAYRRVAMQLHYELPRGAHNRAVLIASPAEQEPDPRPALALAVALADELQQKVLLIDACTRHPLVSKAVGARETTAGFSNLLEADGLCVSDLALASSHPLVSVLSAGAIERDMRPARPDRLESIVSSAVRKFDFVVLAGGSVLHDPVCLALAPYAGCVLLSVTENLTRKSDLNTARNLLDACKARKVALVLNARGRRNLQLV